MLGKLVTTFISTFSGAVLSTSNIHLITTVKVFALSLLLFTTLLRPVKACPPSCECINKSTVEVSCKDGQLLNIFTQLDPDTYRLTLDNVYDMRNLKQARMHDLKASKIVKLKITASSVKDVEDNAFDRLSSLEELDLSVNDIMMVDEHTFDGLKELKSLNISHNRLTSLGQALASLPNLVTVDISANFLKDIPEGAFSSQPLLTSLKLDGNPLENLRKTSFTGLSKVREFRARDCKLVQIESGVFSQMPALVVIDLGHNRLTNVPAADVLSKLLLLRMVYLDNNEIKVLGENVFTNIHLQSMDLSYNRINKMDALVFKEASMREVDLSFNSIISLNRAVLKPLANHMTNLNLAGNPLQQLESDVFSDLHLLETLNLSSCSLETLQPDLLKDLPVLHRLDISHNSLQSVSQPVLEIFDRLDIVAMHENSWTCDCQIKPLRDWLKLASSTSKIRCPPYHKVSKSCLAMRCSLPSGLQNKQLSLVEDSELEECEHEKSSSLPASTQGAIVASCLGFAVILLIITIFMWWRGKTLRGLKRVCVPSEAESSHVIDEDSKIPPFIDCDRTSLTTSDHNYVIRHYFDKLVTDPKLIADEENDAEEEEGAAASPGGAPKAGKERDSLYSSQPSLYSNHADAAYGMESTV